MSAVTNVSKLKRSLLSPERSEVGQSASAHEVPQQSEWECRTHGCAAKETQPGRRKPGGQPGNSNALKYGFYTKNFSLAERRGLQAAEGVVLGDEISLLRVLIRALKLKRSQTASAKSRTHRCTASAA